MKKRLTGTLLILCMVLAMLPMPAIAADNMMAISGLALYKVNMRDPVSDGSVTAPDLWNNWNIPYRLSPGGDIQGEIPYGTVLEASASDGTWLKVKYQGRDCYVFQAKVSNVSEPDIVSSPWAKERLSYYGGYIGTKDVWPTAANDWTKPITRGDMAEMIFLLFRGGDAPFQDEIPFYKKEQFTDIKVNDFIGGKNIGAAAHYLASMGVIPGGGKFNAAVTVTYGEFSDTLIKLAAYIDKYRYEGRLGVLTKADITKFAVGGDTSAGAKITKEQARIMSDAYKCWDTEKLWLADAVYNGANLMNPGAFVMDVNLGKYPNQPHVVIGADGKGELSNTSMQKFKVTYKKTLPAVDPKNASLTHSGLPMKLFTIQTEDGKYLATDGLPSNGSRLTTQGTEFLWWIYCDELGFPKVNIMVPGFYDQRLNASGRSKKDGTHIITWYTENKWRDPAKDPAYPLNSEFKFYMVHGVNSKTPTLPTKHNHGGYIASYPAKTTYKVGQGFDSTGFKMMYLDGNNGWKTKDATANYKLYTSDGVELTQGRPFTTTGTKIVEIVQNTGWDWAHRTVRGRCFITVTK